MRAANRRSVRVWPGQRCSPRRRACRPDRTRSAGGIEPQTGEEIDRHPPLRGERSARQPRDRAGRGVVPTTLHSIPVDYRHWCDQGRDPTVGETRRSDRNVQLSTMSPPSSSPHKSQVSACPASGGCIRGHRHHALRHRKRIDPDQYRYSQRNTIHLKGCRSVPRSGVSTGLIDIGV